jgi:hypothetical protein
MRFTALETSFRDKYAPRYTNRFSRREFIKLTVIASGGLGLWLAGCSPGDEQVTGNERQLAVVEEWIRALNAEDPEAFEGLHTESVLATIHYRRDLYSGRENVWEVYRTSTGNQIEKIITFSQDQLVCLLVNATKSNRSQCYVFDFVDGQIDKVFEYASGSYNLASSPQFTGIEVIPDNTGLHDRMGAMDEMFVKGLNNRDFSLPDVKETASMFVPTSSDPIVGKASIIEDGKDYVRLFSNVNHEKIDTFGQGNLVCTHVMVDGAPKGCLCFVAVFEDEKIAELYEFWSEARLEG